MEPLALKPEFAFAIVTALLQLGALYGVLRSTMTRLEKDRDEDRRTQQAAQAETQRLVKAVHARLDGVGTRVNRLELEQARQDERLKNLRITQRFRLRGAVEAPEDDEDPTT